MTIQPYLFFDGRCEEALEFYKKTLGAEVTTLMRFKECPEPQTGEGCGDGRVDPEKVMHCEIRIGETRLLASDGMCQGRPKFEGISLTLSVANDAEAERRFAALAESGQIQMPLTKTFFSSKFGMVADRFGVSWMIIVEG